VLADGEGVGTGLGHREPFLGTVRCRVAGRDAGNPAGHPVGRG
jgi:hypothetical protein